MRRLLDQIMNDPDVDELLRRLDRARRSEVIHSSAPAHL
jgi:hypothetical protein